MLHDWALKPQSPAFTGVWVELVPLSPAPHRTPPSPSDIGEGPFKGERDQRVETEVSWEVTTIVPTAACIIIYIFKKAQNKETSASSPVFEHV